MHAVTNHGLDPERSHTMANNKSKETKNGGSERNDNRPSFSGPDKGGQKTEGVNKSDTAEVKANQHATSKHVIDFDHAASAKIHAGLDVKEAWGSPMTDALRSLEQLLQPTSSQLVSKLRKLRREIEKWMISTSLYVYDTIHALLDVFLSNKMDKHVLTASNVLTAIEMLKSYPRADVRAKTIKLVDKWRIIMELRPLDPEMAASLCTSDDELVEKAGQVFDESLVTCTLGLCIPSKSRNVLILKLFSSPDRVQIFSQDAQCPSRCLKTAVSFHRWRSFLTTQTTSERDAWKWPSAGECCYELTHPRRLLARH